MKNILLYIYCALAILLLSNEGQSQTIRSQNPFIINASMNRFWQNDSTAYLEIATACYPGQATLYKDSTGSHRSIEFWIKIKNNSNNEIVRADRFRIPVTMQDSVKQLPSGVLVNKFTYTLEYGSYSLGIYGFDKGNPARRDSVIIHVEVYRRPKTVTLSDIELASSITESKDTKDLFYKNSYRVISNPTLIFGREDAPIPFSYSELYNLNRDSAYSVTACIINGKGELLKYKKKLQRYGARDVVEVNSLNISSIPSGKYKFAVIVADTLGHEIARSEKTFFIHNSHLLSQAVPIISAKTAEFVGLTNDELVAEFRKAKYVASSDDQVAFEKLSSIEARREFLARFWSSIENGQHGQTNLTRAMYLDRVLKANQRYHAMGKEGWLTDRGRVYLLYAEPDEVERFPNSDNGKPYEIWDYNQIESGVIFVFIDQTGFGDYRLVHSTKRGELQDESWQQHLQ